MVIAAEHQPAKPAAKPRQPHSPSCLAYSHCTSQAGGARAKTYCFKYEMPEKSFQGIFVTEFFLSAIQKEESSS